MKAKIIVLKNLVDDSLRKMASSVYLRFKRSNYEMSHKVLDL